MSPYFCAIGAFALLTAISSAEAAEIVLADVGVSFSIPEDWRYEAKDKPGRLGILIKPKRDDDPIAATMCRIDRHAAPDRFRRYTRQELNDLYAGQPLSAADFAKRLSAIVGIPVSVSKHGQAMLGDALAYWAQSTASVTDGASATNLVSKTFLSITPGFAWNIQCIVGTHGGKSEANAIYKQSEATFEAFFSSIRFSSPK